MSDYIDYANQIIVTHWTDENDIFLGRDLLDLIMKYGNVNNICRKFGLCMCVYEQCIVILPLTIIKAVNLNHNLEHLKQLCAINPVVTV